MIFKELDYNQKQVNNKSNQSREVEKSFTDFLHESVVVSSMGAWELIKSFFTIYAPLSVVALFAILWFSYHISTEALHIKFIHDLEPSVFTYEKLQFMYRLHRNFYWVVISLLLTWPIVVALGIRIRFIRTKYMLIFYKMGLKNHAGETPRLLKKKKIDSSRSRYIFDSCGLGISEFEVKKERFESQFKMNVESIKYGNHKGRIEIVFNSQDFPEKLNYSELSKKYNLPQNGFFVGHSCEGILIEKISKLPHMLIAGTTGSGKSIFFKQTLLGLLESTPHIQMYLIDLKGGLEMMDFTECPNVMVVKTMSEALVVLRKLEREMKSRFNYLEKIEKKSISTQRDKKDRIVLGIDEASVLYMNRSPHDPEKTMALDARKLADSIAKLSRAAAIHMIFATQKVENQVIPTSVTENVSGRMMFRTNSFQGSNQVIGSKDAMLLPEIPGRGIWNHGTKKYVVQAPYIRESLIKDRCKQISKDFQSGRRICFNPMVGEVKKKQNKEKQDIVYDIVKPSNLDTKNKNLDTKDKDNLNQENDNG